MQIDPYSSNVHPLLSQHFFLERVVEGSRHCQRSFWLQPNCCWTCIFIDDLTGWGVDGECRRCGSISRPSPFKTWTIPVPSPCNGGSALPYCWASFPHMGPPVRAGTTLASSLSLNRTPLEAVDGHSFVYVRRSRIGGTWGHNGYSLYSFSWSGWQI